MWSFIGFIKPANRENIMFQLNRANRKAVKRQLVYFETKTKMLRNPSGVSPRSPGVSRISRWEEFSKPTRQRQWTPKRAPPSQKPHFGPARLKQLSSFVKRVRCFRRAQVVM